MKPRKTVFGLPLIAWLIYFGAMVAGGVVLQEKSGLVQGGYLAFIILGTTICYGIDMMQWNKQQEPKKEEKA